MRRRRKWLRAKVFYKHIRNNSKEAEQEASLKGPQCKQKRNTCPRSDDTGKSNTMAMKIKEMSLPMLTINSKIQNENHLFRN